MTDIGPQNVFSQELHAAKYRAEGETFDDYAVRYARAASDNEEHFHLLLDGLREQRILPAGRQQLAVGREFNLTASNCFVSGTIEDSMSGIMRSCTEAALTLRMGGGVGTDFSAIRPSGEPIRGLGLKAFSSGPVSFMSIWNAMSSTVMSAGHRRGALMGVLRCIAGDSLIHTLDGRKPIRDLVGQRPYVYACDAPNRKIRIVQADRVFVSDRQRSLVRVMFDDFTYLDCTSDHLIMLSSGDYHEAGSLARGASIMAIDHRINQHGNSKRFVRTVACTNGRAEYEHRLIARDILGHEVTPEWHVHHADEDPCNNDPLNLQMISRSEHAKAHDSNLAAVRAKIAASRKGRTLEEVYGKEKADQWKERYRAARMANLRLAGNHRVVSVDDIGVAEEVYDISLPAHHNFAVNGIFAHNCDHPDIMTFVRAKSDSTSLTNFNISVAVTDAFMEALASDGLYDLQWNGAVTGQARAVDVWSTIMERNWDHAEPGVLFIDRANADNNLWYCETFAATNPCVTGDTEILTNTGNRKIADCVGEIVTIWNGWQWSDVEPRITGTDQPIIAVELDNGALIRCTPYHKFILAAGRRVEAKELRPGDELAKFTMPEIAGPFDPERVIRVVSIATAGVAEYVYCFTDSANNSGVFNGVMLGNCAEQWLPPYGACLLASLNIPKYLTGTGYTLRDASKPAYEFNWEQFDIDVEATVRALDNVIDRSTYPLPQQRAEQIAKRRMGLGCTGMANALEMQGLPYGSPAYIAAQSDILARLRNVAYIASVKLAQEKGAFPLYDERYLTGKFIKTLPDYIIASIAKHGIRNALLLSIAPTGTISLTADNVSSGIEPPYSLQSKRLVHMPDGQREVTLDDYAFAKAGVRGRTAYEVTPEQHVDVLCAAQRYVDNSVSKTCNVNGKEFGFGPFKDLYRRGYEGGAKGIALFNISGKRFGIMASASDEKNVEGACTIDPISGIKSCAA